MACQLEDREFHIHKIQNMTQDDISRFSAIGNLPNPEYYFTLMFLVL